MPGRADQAWEPVLERAYLELFEQFAALTMAEAVYLQAAPLRARFGLKTPDARCTSPALSTIAATRCGPMTTG
jgi:hypothetical protein